ncbi:protein-histidine kinase [Gigaspora margarita]|uniref:Protein-histidine kinase n=1 Tax=Gigaspora margarita TaxID=4874 RepID=A0A8H3X928_GIGMA|nr:protein-histidine kinase [Gigaspora margarita]
MSLPLNNNGNIENEEQAYAKMVYNYDWSSTVLGPIDSWDPALKNALNLCLHTVFPAFLCIYPDWISIYNPAWKPIFKSKLSYQKALGKSVRENWPEICDILNSQFESVRISGKGLFFNEFCYTLERDGYAEDVFFDHTFSPVIRSDGSVCAIFGLGRETTQNVLSARRLKILNEFGRRISEVTSLENACQIITKVLSDNNADIPYALIYLVNHKSDSGSIARLIATTFDYNDKTGKKFPDYLPETLEMIDLAKDVNKTYDTYIELKRHDATYSFLKCDSWPISLLLKEGGHIKVLLKDDSQAVLLLTKISLCEGQVLSAILICGINQRCALDEQYMEFLKLTLSHMNTFLLHAKTIEEEKMRSKVLADLNRQKVLFFQGISHELKSMDLLSIK